MYLIRRAGHPPRRPGGFTIVEMMVSMTIALAVAAITTSIASNVFAANTQSIYMIQLTQEMRSAIQLISRDIRRSGYEDDALARFLSTEAVDSGVTMGALDADDTANCLQLQYEDLDGDLVNAVYRLRVISAVGRVSVHFGATSDCDTSMTAAGWADISDPLLTSITGLQFVLTDQRTDVAENSDTGNVIQVGVEQISIVISAQLRGNAAVNRTIVNEVQLRNLFLTV